MRPVYAHPHHSARCLSFLFSFLVVCVCVFAPSILAQIVLYSAPLCLCCCCCIHRHVHVFLLHLNFSRTKRKKEKRKKTKKNSLWTTAIGQQTRKKGGPPPPPPPLSPLHAVDYGRGIINHEILNIRRLYAITNNGSRFQCPHNLYVQHVRPSYRHAVSRLISSFSSPYRSSADISRPLLTYAYATNRLNYI